MYGKSYDGTNKKVFWQEMWRHELYEALKHDPVVIIPVGSIEQHGPHSPTDIDISIPYHLAAEAATRTDDYPIIVAPPVWTGFTHFNMGHIGTITVTLETYIAVLSDICRSIKANGFERMILLNGHGGNVAPTQAISVKLAQEDVWALHISYFHMVDDELKEWGDSDDSIGHGGEWETSLQLHLRGHLIDLDKPRAQRSRAVVPRPCGWQVCQMAGAPPRSRRGRDGRSLCGQCRERRAHFQPGRRTPYHGL